MDQYGVPATDRPKWFKLNVFGGWGAATILAVLLWRCMQSSLKAEIRHSNEKFELQTRTRAEMRAEFEKSMDKLDEKDKQLREAIRTLDSIKSRS